MKTNKTSDFNEYVNRYDEWYYRNKFAYLSEVFAVRQLMPKGLGLEIGVNTGRFASVLGIPFGIDPAKEGLKIADQKGVKVALAVGESLPFKDKILDYVLMVITLSFLHGPKEVLYETKRVLKQKGKIIIGIIDKNSFLGESYQQKKAKGLPFYREAILFSPAEVIGFLKECKFKDFKIYQTVFQLPESLENIQKPKGGYGEGGFVVIGAEKRD